MMQVQEPALIQAFISKPAIEGFDVSVLVGLAWLDESQLHSMPMTPSQHRPTAEFLAIVRPDYLRVTSFTT